MRSQRAHDLADDAVSDRALAPGKATRSGRIQRKANADAAPADAAPADAAAAAPADAATPVATASGRTVPTSEHEDPFAMHLLGDDAPALGGGSPVIGEGAPLPGGLRGPLEAAAGADLSSVRLHTDGAAADRAADLDAHAYALGADIHFAAGAYDPDSAAGRHLIAHEVAHTVQQGASAAPADAAPQLAALDVSRPGDASEREADGFADAFSSGRPAPSLSRAAPRLARFSATEHKYLGDVGSGDVTYQVAGDNELTHGDLVMLSGDHFSPDEVLLYAHTPSRDPGKQMFSIDLLICALRWKQPGDARFAKGGAWHGLTFSDEVQAYMEKRYNELASDNTNHFANPDGEAGPTPSAGSTYRELHTQAIRTAYAEGQRGAALHGGMFVEACGQHFLTDSFSAGHVDTARAAAVAHWNAIYPEFTEQFVEKMARAIAAELAAGATNLGANLIPLSKLESGAAAMIREKMQGQPVPSIGGLVSLIAHDHDNDHGLYVTNDLGWHWQAFGDGYLHDPGDEEGEWTNQEVALAAVTLGCEDVRSAYSLGIDDAGKKPLGEGALYDAVRARTPAPAEPGRSMFGPEQLMPRVDPSIDQGKQGWEVNSLEKLWEAKVRTDHSATYGDGIFEELQPGGDIGKVLDGLVAGIEVAKDAIGDETGREIPLHGYIYPQEAFIKGVLEPLRDDRCREFLLDMVNLRRKRTPHPAGVPEDGPPHDAGVP